MFLKIEELKHVVIGRIKDAGYNAIQIDCNEWLTLYPQLTDYRIEVISPSGEIYFADTTMQGGVITWKLTARDTFQVGNGQYQVVAVGGNGERKTSSHPKITILEIANGTDADVPPDLSDAWTDTVIRNANAAIDAAEISKQNSEAAIDSANRATALAEEISEATNRAEDAAERAEAAAERAESAGGSGGSAGGIVIETDPTVYDWAKQPQKPTYTADEINAIDKDALPQAIEAALAQAKESGEFDGAPGLKGDPGADGGYYQPSVTDGVLSWTPSKGGMPSVPASDVRGPAGQDGQPGKDGADGAPGSPGKTAYQYAQDGGYKGTEAEFAQKMAQEIPEPYTLPVATADRLGGVMVGNGLNVDEAGRVSVKPEGMYELIEVIEVKSTDEYTAIQRTQTPDGKLYAFEAVYIRVNSISVAGTASISHRYRAGSYTAELNLSIGSGDNGKVACAEAIITAGKLEIKQTHWSAYEWTGNNVQANARQYFVHNAPIERIEMSRNGGFGEVTFAIYGKWKE